MNIIYSPKFAKEYKKLPLEIKIKAEKKEKIFRKNPKDVSVKTHKLSGKLKNFWAFSIDYNHRIIFEFVNKKTIYFHSVGNHSVYLEKF